MDSAKSSAMEMWNKFIDHLHVVQPLGKPDKDTGKTAPHQNFLGSVASYRKVFLDANKE